MQWQLIIRKIANIDAQFGQFFLMVAIITTLISLIAIFAMTKMGFLPLLAMGPGVFAAQRIARTPG
ncbi:hypothetical protein M8997_004435 [Phyllobacterium sp. 21LDTY02-6]|uniref:hypothetical protein n=1 Tax=Phyllobacterium sp. 21LDTY02-6 TaxID=2944903 RepID=UPI0020211E5D|nr:hypothetical protein [Phyllobacterium sp. 21LDTY02-6]MCO4316419.1 hypothetical protein [Phyllobacterium sp. 21LDTY02-6]